MVKVGDLEIGQSTGIVLDKNSTTVTVPLTQLAARVDLSVKMALKDEVIEWTDENYIIKQGEKDIDIDSLMSELKGKGLNEALNILQTNLPNVTIKEIDEKGYDLNARNLFYYDTPVEVDNISSKGYKGMLIPKLPAIRIRERQGDVLGRLSIAIQNIRTTAFSLDRDNEEEMFLLPEKDISEFYSKDAGKYIFYTYSRSINAVSPLKVSLVGDVFKKTVYEKTPVYSQWVVMMDNLPKKDQTKPGTLLVGSGWKGDHPILFLMQKSGGDWHEDSSQESSEDITSSDTPYAKCSKLFPIVPEAGVGDNNTDGILSGNLYDVSITITKIDKNVTPKIEWIVTPWSSATVDIPTFN